MSLFDGDDFLDKAQAAIDAAYEGVENVLEPRVRLSGNPADRAAEVMLSHGLVPPRGSWPSLTDSDRDGIPDVIERAFGTDPFDAASRPGKFEPRKIGARNIGGRIIGPGFITPGPSELGVPVGRGFSSNAIARQTTIRPRGSVSGEGMEE